MTTAGPSRPTVILVAHAVHDHGGMERAMAELIRRGQDRAHFVVVARELAADLRADVEWERVAVPARPAPLRFAAFFLLGSRAVRRRSSGALVHTVGAIVANDVDLASVHYCHAAARRVPRAERASPTRRLNSAIDRWISLAAERFVYRRRARELAAVSDSVAGELAREYPGVPVVLTPNGVDAERFRPNPDARVAIRGRLGIADDTPVVLFVGGDWGRKGLFVLLEALRDERLAARPWCLVVVGPGDGAALTSDARIGESGGDRLRIIGAVDDSAPYFAAADLFVLPSAYETFGLAAFEAAASGLPVIATAVGEIPMLLAEQSGDRAGVLVDRDPRSVADAVVAYLDDSALRWRSGMVARSRAEAWSWDASVDAVFAAYATMKPRS